MSNLFISHSSRDNAAAKELQARLEEQGHRSVFLDLDPETGIQAGVSWERTLYTKLRACRAVVALCSDSYLASQWCFAEIALARMEGKELFVLQIDPWSEQTQLPSILTEEQYIDLRTNQDDGYQRLWNGFKVKGIVAAEHREWGPDDPPYPGLRAFDESDAPIFFGREQEVREGLELLNRVERQGHPRLVMVLGSSGSGKSSLARAGLVPRLRRDGNRWLVVGPFRPGPKPARELAAALSQAFDRAGETRPWEGIHRRLTSAAPAAHSPSAVATGEPAAQMDPARQRLLEALHSMADELTEADTSVAQSVKLLEEFLASAPVPALLPCEPKPESAGSPLVELAQQLRLVRGTSGGSVLLVIDQFEELLGHDAEGTDHPANCFLQQLRVGLDAADSPILALATMRSDYLGMLQQSIPVQGIGFKSLSVGPMSPEGMKEIIERPALLGQIQLGDGLTDRLLRETGSSDALPLLAFTLRVMWDRYHSGRLLEMQHYEAIGKLEGAVAQVADDTLETALELGEEDRLRDAFLSLARPAAEGSDWTRQPVRWDDLDESVQPMLQCFVDQRLLVKRGDGTVEVAHEALFRSWKTLRGWLDENAEGLHLLRDIRAEAAKWDAADSAEKKEYLWRGGRLARALELREGGVLALEELEEAFVDASDRTDREEKDAEEKRRKNKLRLMTAIAIAGFAGLLIFVGLTIWANRQATIATAGRLASLAISQPPENLDQALLLSVEAQRAADLAATRNSLLRSLQSGLVETLREHDSAILSLAVSHDGLLAAAGPQGEVRVWTRSAGGWSADTLPGLKLSSITPGVAFSPSGDRLATASSDGLRLWRHEGGRWVPTLLDGGQALCVAFSPTDEETLVSGSGDGLIRLWSTRDGTGGRTLRTHSGEVLGVAYTPDGKTIAAAGDDGTLRLWDFEIDRVTELALLEGGDGPARLGSVAFSKHGVLAVGGESGMVWLGRRRGDEWVETPLEVEWSENTLVPSHRRRVTSVAFSPNGDRLVSGAEDSTVRLWDVPGNRALGEPLRGHAGVVRGVAFLPGGVRLVSGGDDRTLRFWELEDGGPLGTTLGDHGKQVRSLAYSSRGNLLATGGEDNRVLLWEEKAGEWSGTPLPAGHEDWVSSLAFSPDGTRLVSGDLSGKLWLWEKNAGGWSGALLPGGHVGWVNGLAFSPDLPRFVSVGEDKKVLLWDAEGNRWTAQPLPSLHKADVNAVAFSPDGNRIASGGEGGTLLIWQEQEGGWQATPLPMEPDEPVNSLAFSPDGKLLVSGQDLGTLRVWTEESGGWEAATLPRLHDGDIHGISFSPDGKRLVTAGEDETVQLWDIGSGSRLGEPLRGHRGQVRGVAFLADGKMFGSAGNSGIVMLWDHRMESWRKRACRAANLKLLPDWKLFMGTGHAHETCPNLPDGLGEFSNRNETKQQPR